MTTTQTTRTQTADNGRTTWTEVLTSRYAARLVDGEWAVVEIETGYEIDWCPNRAAAEKTATEMNWVEVL
jgi:hypothetical protein